MKYIFVLLFLCLNFTYANTITINEKTNNFSILEKSEIYLDKTKKLNLKEIKNTKILNNDKETLLYGAKRDFNLWIKFTLQNNSNQNIKKILALDHPQLYNIFLYDDEKIHRQGILHQDKNKLTINPSFILELQKNEKKTYYLKINTLTTGLIINLKLYNEKSYMRKDFTFQILMFSFFAAMLILAIYNSFLYIYTKDKTYLYYVLYVFSMLLYQFMYLGFAEVYFFNQTYLTIIFDNFIAISTLQVIFVILFIKKFLDTYKFPKINTILTIYFYISIIITLFTYKNILLDSAIVAIFIPFTFLLIWIGFLALKDNNPLAKLYLLGWGAISSSWIFMLIFNIGIFNVFEYFPYYVETAILFESTIFSIALAKRINLLQNDKLILQSKLTENEKNENERLILEVKEKTKDLNTLLEEKEILFKELYHRVKNNMQIIISLMRLQKNSFEEKEIKDKFQLSISRIQAMSSVHEFLYKDSKITKLNTKKYFSLLLQDLQYTYDKQITIHYDIKSTLNNDDAIYCGLIINELVTNSYKHAFETKGDIYISLVKNEDSFELIIKDTGKGYIIKKSKGLGTLIIKTLVEEQLDGEILIDSQNGVMTKITWKTNEE